MKVHIEENLYLESDERQFIIREYSGKSDDNGKELFKNHGYYASIQQALKGLVKMKIKQSNAKTLYELIQDINYIGRYIESKFNI